VENLEDICKRLSDYIEEYLNEADDRLSKADIYLDGASRDSMINGMLCKD
jgi:hypothetical protein